MLLQNDLAFYTVVTVVVVVVVVMVIMLLHTQYTVCN